jgi:hypothetical protein
VRTGLGLIVHAWGVQSSALSVARLGFTRQGRGRRRDLRLVGTLVTTRSFAKSRER